MPSHPPVDQVTTVNPVSPGNALVSNGQRVSIQQVLTGVGGRGTALDVIITPAGDTPHYSASAQSGADVVQNHASRSRAGLTYEQELFRTKWGWAAYNAANRAATWDLGSSTPANQ